MWIWCLSRSSSRLVTYRRSLVSPDRIRKCTHDAGYPMGCRTPSCHVICLTSLKVMLTALDCRCIKTLCFKPQLLHLQYMRRQGPWAHFLDALGMRTGRGHVLNKSGLEQQKWKSWNAPKTPVRNITLIKWFIANGLDWVWRGQEGHQGRFSQALWMGQGSPWFENAVSHDMTSALRTIMESCRLLSVCI